MNMQDEILRQVLTEYDATFNDIGYTPQPTKAQEKAISLAQSAQAKEANLGLAKATKVNDYANLENSITKFNGLDYQNKNKIWNNFTDAQIQQYLSDVADQQVYANEDGTMYQQKIDANGNLVNVPYTGDTRRLYAYGTKDSPDELKIGLARGDASSSDVRYIPGLAEKQGLQVGKDGYGWEPGQSGVDVAKNRMDLLLPYDVATRAEGMLHGRKEVLSSRSVQPGDEYGRSLRGSGASEYYRTPEGVLGDTSTSKDNVSYVLPDIQANKLVSQYSANSPKVSKEEALKMLRGEPTVGSMLAESVDALQAGAVKLAADTGDFILDAAKFWGDGNSSLLDEFKKQENIDKLVGYDRTESVARIDKAYEDIKDGNYLQAIAGMIPVAPQIAAESIPMMVGMFVGVGKFTALGKAMGLAKTAAEAKKLEKAATVGQRMVKRAADEAGFLTVLGGQVNNRMEERKANNDGVDATPFEAVGVMAEEFSMLALDRFAFGKILGVDKFKKALTDTAKLVPDTGKLRVAKKLGEASGRITAAVGAEAAQEFIQEFGNSLGAEYGTSKFGTDIVTDERIEQASKAAIAGGAAGGAMRGTKEVVDVISPTKQKLLDRVKQSDANREANILKEDIESVVPGKETMTKAEMKVAKEKVDSLAKKIDSFDDAKIAIVPELLDTLNVWELTDKDSIKKVAEIKQKVANRLSESTNVQTDAIKLGSEPEAKAFMEEMFANAKDKESPTLLANMVKIGSRFNIKEDDIIKIKNEAEVETEITTGRRGYKTYDRELSKLKANPKANSKKIARVEASLEYFEMTQVDRLDRMQRGISEIEAKLADGTQNLKTQEKIKYAGGGSWTVNFTPDGKVHPQTYKQVDNLKRTIANIGSIIKKHNIKRAGDANKEPVSPYTRTKESFGVPTKLASKDKLGFYQTLKRRIKDGETIFTNISSKVKMPHEYGAIKKLKNAEYVQVDDNGHPKAGTGRWVPKALVKVDPAKVEAAAKEAEKKTVTKLAKKLKNNGTLTDEEVEFKKQHETEVDQAISEVDFKSKIEDIDLGISIHEDLIRSLKDKQKDLKGEEKQANYDKINEVKDKIKALVEDRKQYFTKDVTEEILANSLSTIVPEKKVKGLAGAKYPQPTNVNKFFKVRKSASSLLAGIHARLFDNKFVQDARTNASAKLKKFLAPINLNTDEKTKLSKEMMTLNSSPARGLIFDKDKNVNENVAVAMDVALTEYVANGAFNLGPKTRESISIMTGKREFEITNEMVLYFKDLGMYTKNAADDMGKAIIKSLGLTMNDDIPFDVYAKMVADLGNMAIHLGVENGELEIVDMNLAPHNKLLGLPINEATAKKKVSFVRYTKKGKLNIEKNKLKFESYKESLNVEDSFIKRPKTKPVSKEDISIRNNPVTNQPEKAQEVLKILRNEKFVAQEEVVSWLIDEDNTDIVLKHLGYKTPKELLSMSYYDRESQEAVNEEIIRSIDALKEMVELGMSDEMYFDWFYARNGRYMMDTNTINPQTDKLHRFAIVPAAHKVYNLDIGTADLDANTDEQNLHRSLFNTAIAQAFGMATDKKSTKEIQAFGEMLLGKDPNELMDMLNTFEFTDGIEVEHLSHYLQGVEAIRAYKDAKGKPFDTYLSMESDAVTSGFGLKLLQLPLLADPTGNMSVFDKTKEWLAKTGIFIDKTVESMNDEVAKDDFFDSYETLAIEVDHKAANDEANYAEEEKVSAAGKKYTVKPLDALQKYDNVVDHTDFISVLPTTQQMEDGTTKVSKALRTLFKDPFMTFNYSRGITSIKKGLGYIIADDIISRIVNDELTYDSKFVRDLSRAYGFKNLKELKNALINKDPSTIRREGKPDLYKYLSDMGSATYGHLAAKSLSKHFAQFVEANNVINATFAEIFIKYNEVYLAEVQKVEEAQNAGISKKQELDIIQSLRDKFPLIRGPYSKLNDLSDTIAIFDDDNTDVKKLEENYGTASTRLANGDKKITSKIRQLKAAINAGSVIPIHYIDAGIKGNTIIDSKGGILGIHDAIIPNLLKTKEVVKAYNRNVIEVSKNYSVIEALLETYDRTIKDANPSLRESLVDIVNRAKEARDELFSSQIDVVHMSAVQGSKYTHKATSKRKPTKTFKEGDTIPIFSQFIVKDTSDTLNGKHITYHFKPATNEAPNGPDIKLKEGDKASAYIVGRYNNGESGSKRLAYYVIEVEINGTRIKTQPDGRPLHITLDFPEGQYPAVSGEHAKANPDKIVKYSKPKKITVESNVFRGKFKEPVVPGINKADSNDLGSEPAATTTAIENEIFRRMGGTVTISVGNERNFKDIPIKWLNVSNNLSEVQVSTDKGTYTFNIAPTGWYKSKEASTGKVAYAKYLGEIAYQVVRDNDLGSDKDSTNSFRKATKKILKLKARKLAKKETITTVIDGEKETVNTGNPGDYVVTGTKGEQWIVPGDKFDSKYNIVKEVTPDVDRLKHQLENAEYELENARLHQKMGPGFGIKYTEDLREKANSIVKEAEDKVNSIKDSIENSTQILEISTKPVDIQFKFADSYMNFKASWGEDMIANPGDALVYEDGKLSYRIEKEVFDATYDYTTPRTNKNSDPRVKTENLRKDALKSVEGIKAIINELPDVDAGYKKYVLGLLDSIDPTFIPNLHLYINKDAERNVGVVKATGEIIVDVAPTMDKSDKTATEVYAHELMHAITKFAVARASRDPEVAGILQKINRLMDEASELFTVKDFMPKQYLDKQQAEDRAKEIYDYVFSSVDEFIAYGTTNPMVMNKLKAHKLKNVEKDASTLFEKLEKLFTRFMDIVLGRVQWNASNSTLKNQLHQLTFELMKYNNEAINSVNRMEEKKVSLTNALMNSLNIGNAAISKAVDVIVNYIGGDKDKKIVRPRNATRMENVVFLVRFLPQLLFRGDLKQIRNQVFSVLGLTPEGAIQNIIRDVEEPDALERQIEYLQMQSGAIDRVRELTVDVVRSDIREKFGRKLTQVEEEAITMSGIDIDLSGIYNEYGYKKIAKLLSDKNELDKQISLVKTQLGRLDRANFGWHDAQAHGLGYYMATGIAGKVQNLNAHNIAAGLLTDKRVRPNPKVVAKIDELATLVGMKYTSEGSNNILADLINENKDAVQLVMDLNESAKKEAKEKLFDSEVHIIKGYSKEITDDTIDLVIRPASEESAMRMQGYTLIHTLKKDPQDRTSATMAVYRSKMFVNDNYNRAATRITNIAKRGTSLTDISYKSGEFTNYKALRNEVKRIREESFEIVEKMRRGEWDPTVDGTSNFTPVMNEEGIIVDYRYMMSKKHKKEWLNQDTHVTEVLGRTLANIGDKVDSDIQNRVVLEAINADMRQNYIKGRVIGKNGREYIKIEPNSRNAAVAEIYKLLPKHMLEAIKDSNDGYIAVRRDMLHNYFGFRDKSIVDFFGIHHITPQVIQKFIRLAEKMWMQIVSISKVDIVIRTPAVFIGNVISNLMYSIVNGPTNPLRVLKMQYQNMQAITNYLEVQRQIERLRVSNILTKDKERRIATLEKSLEKYTAIHPLMKAGMYQAIVEDLNKQEYKSSNKLINKISESTSFMPDYVRQGASWLYIGEKTGVFQAITKATQYSDFVARATEYQLLLEKGVDSKVALDSILDVFVNYGKPASAFEEYLNNMGLFMFTKYMKRITRAVNKSIKDKPLNVLLSILGQEAFFQVDDIQDQNLLTRSYSNLNQDMWEHIRRAYTPTALEVVGIM